MCFSAPGARLARYICNDAPLQMIREAVRRSAARRRTVAVSRRTRSTRAPLNSLKASIGIIAKQAARAGANTYH